MILLTHRFKAFDLNQEQYVKVVYDQLPYAFRHRYMDLGLKQFQGADIDLSFDRLLEVVNETKSKHASCVGRWDSELRNPTV